MTKTTLSEECRTHNERFGATAAESADLKGSAGMPPLRQAAIPFFVPTKKKMHYKVLKKALNSPFSILHSQLITALLLLIASCTFSGIQNNTQAVESATVVDTVFASPLDSMEWVLKNRRLTAGEQLSLYMQISWYHQWTDFEKARNYAMEGIALAEKEKNKSMLAKLHRVAGVVYWTSGVRDSAWIYLNKALPEARELNDKRLEAFVLLAMGNLSTGESAIRYFLDALKYHESVENPDDINKQSIRAITRNIATIYTNLGNFQQAEKYYPKIELMAKEENDMDALINVYLLYAESYTNRNPELALDYAMKALKVNREESSFFYRLSYVFQMISHIYCVGLNDYAKALEYGKESLRAAEEFGGRTEIAVACSAIANAYYYLGNYAQSEAMALRGFETDSLAIENNLLLSIARANIMMGRKEKALDYLAKYEQHNSTIVNKDYQQRLMEMEIRYETEKKEFEIERQKQIIKSQNLQRGLLVGGIALSLVILALLWYMLRLRIRRNRALTERNDTLAEMNATKDKFFNIISHDIKNPAITQRDAMKLLVDNAFQWDADTLDRFYNGLLETAESNVELIYNLLGWAQLQTGRMVFRPATFNLAACLRSEISLIRNMAEKKNIRFTANIPADADVTGDSNMIATVVRNLLTNAVKFTSTSGEVSLSVSLTSSKTCTISITDTGTGMNEDQINNLFRLDSARSSRGTAGEQGSGLGLIVCKELLEKHGATLHVESEVGRGSRFWFNI